MRSSEPARLNGIVRPTTQELADLVQRLRSRVGLVSAPVTRRIEAGAIAKFARATGQTDPRLLDPEGLDGIMEAPPTYLSVFCNDVLPGLIVHEGLPFTMYLHTEDHVELLRQLRAGDRITAVAHYADVFVKEGRNGPILFQTAEMTLSDAAGKVVARVRVSTASFNPQQALNDE
jgi:hypothetical protein